MEEYIGIVLFYFLVICILILIVLAITSIVICFSLFIKGMLADIFNKK